MVLCQISFSKKLHRSVTINFFCSFFMRMRSFSLLLQSNSLFSQQSGSQSLLSKFHPSDDIRREASPPPKPLGSWLLRHQVEQGLLEKADTHRLLQTGQAASTDRSWVEAQQVRVLATDFLWNHKHMQLFCLWYFDCIFTSKSVMLLNIKEHFDINKNFSV